MTKDEAQRKLAEQALIQGEEQHPSFFEAIAEGYALARILRD